MKEHLHLSHKSLPIFINNDSEILILGSFPSVKSREIGFYYGRKQNRFFLTLLRDGLRRFSEWYYNYYIKR